MIFVVVRQGIFVNPSEYKSCPQSQHRHHHLHSCSDNNSKFSKPKSFCTPDISNNNTHDVGYSVSAFQQQTKLQKIATTSVDSHAMQ
ncbi:unnamed protein product [Ceratitis capitata]|uniref:(Mediterranean fruit fly) hypothetical protein n=1 Tax=Ceratitis capitata TaxID=7213 RepID=A0A811UE81_CERCA|nr:unnamed protein product [Ceratitis capitata]